MDITCYIQRDSVMCEHYMLQCYMRVLIVMHSLVITPSPAAGLEQGGEIRSYEGQGGTFGKQIG